MTTTLGTSTLGNTITQTYIALTTAWPYTSGCESQFWIEDQTSTGAVSAYDPSLVSCWNSDALPRWYPQTECLPKILTNTLQNSIKVGSLVCPQSWTQAPYSTPYTGIGPYITCCPPKYTLAPTSVIGPELTYSACTSAVTAGQVLVGIGLDEGLVVYENITTTDGYQSTTITYKSDDLVVGYMLTADWFDTRTHAIPTYTSSSTETPNPDDVYNEYNNYLAIRLGVGITIPAVFLIISVIVFCVVYRRKKRQLLAYQQGAQGGQQTAQIPNQYGQPPNNGMQNQYFPGGPSQYAQQGYTNQGPPPNNGAPQQYGSSPNSGMPNQSFPQGHSQYPQQQGYTNQQPMQNYQQPRPS